jgi:hypothetical protein
MPVLIFKAGILFYFYFLNHYDMKYLHAVLTVIAVCLVLITCAITGILPTANANTTNQRLISVPVNPDGSINVKLVKGETIDVNIDEINDHGVFGSEIPVSFKSPIDVNLKQVDGSSPSYGTLQVKVKN